MREKTFDFYWTQKIVDFLIKMSGVVVTSFATLAVAEEAFSHIEQPWLNFIKGGALMLIEGAFIVSWLAIDSQKNAPMQMKIAWSVTLIVIYIALLVIALEHGEGAAGWAFRFVLAVMIGRSIYEAGVYEVLKQNQRADRDIRSSFAVRRLGRQLAKVDAVKALNVESAQSNYARELGYEISRARMETEHEAALIDVKLFRERLLAKVHAQDRLSRTKLQGQMLLESRQIETIKIPAQSQAKAKARAAQQAGPTQTVMPAPNAPQSAREKTMLKTLLLRKLGENPNRSMETLGKLVKASPTTIQQYLEELLSEGKLRTAHDRRSGYSIANGTALD